MIVPHAPVRRCQGGQEEPDEQQDSNRRQRARQRCVWDRPADTIPQRTRGTRKKKKKRKRGARMNTKPNRVKSNRTNTQKARSILVHLNYPLFSYNSNFCYYYYSHHVRENCLWKLRQAHRFSVLHRNSHHRCPCWCERRCSLHQLDDRKGLLRFRWKVESQRDLGGDLSGMTKSATTQSHFITRQVGEIEAASSLWC